jgi:hypothetical protein
MRNLKIDPHTDNTDYASHVGYKGGATGGKEIREISRGSVTLRSGDGKVTTVNDPAKVKRYIQGISRERSRSKMHERGKEKAAGVKELESDIKKLNPTKKPEAKYEKNTQTGEIVPKRK